MVVIGLDGLEPSLARPLMDAGEMPHLAALRDQGGFARVATTCPAQTPVAWSTFATGLNPGGHGVFDFLRRDPETYLPDLALNRYEQKNAFTPPRVVNLRRGIPLWERLAQRQVASAVIRCPCTYPPDNVQGRLLSGMGVPDLRGGLGTGTFFTTRCGVEPLESEQVEHLLPVETGRYRAALHGPRAPRDRSESTLELTLHNQPADGTVRLRLAGASPEELSLAVGRWSDWVQVRFKLGLLQHVRGIVRFRLLRLEPEIELYASPVNFDPAAPLFPISEPAGYAQELAAELGPYHTTGMVEDHAGLNNGRLDEAAFLDQCAEVWDEREAMLLRELERLDHGLCYCLFDTPDRVQHLFWRFREPDHPANRGRATPPEFARTIEEHYRRADAAVGAALAYADDQTLVIVLSDHGFGPFRRCVDLNAWLAGAGLLALRPGFEPGGPGLAYLQGVDWSQTRAYAIGLSGLFLNLKGRESQGIVAPDDAERLKRQIAQALTGLADPRHGVTAIRDVRTREEVYHGPLVDQAPDLLVQYERGYRAGWSSSMGGISPDVISDNTQAWAGDHIIDPALVPGVLLMNRPFRTEDAGLEDLAPTILDALGLPGDPTLEGRSLIP